MTIGTIYTARKNSQVGMSGNEVEAAKATTADWTSMTTYMNSIVTRQDAKINELEKVVEELRSHALSDAKYISSLQLHIERQLGPPPPSRVYEKLKERDE